MAHETIHYIAHYKFYVCLYPLMSDIKSNIHEKLSNNASDSYEGRVWGAL